MKVIHINTSDYGGAANSCIRLHNSLLEIGIDSILITVTKKNKSLPKHIVYSGKSKLTLFQRIKMRLGIYTPLYIRQHKLLEGKISGFEHFSFTEAEFDLHKYDLLKNADIINLHWVAGFIDYSLFFRSLRKPIVWTLHDMNAFTGGCHYAGNCIGYTTNCDYCPQLAGTSTPTLSCSQLKTKREAYKGSNLHIVAPSKWLKKCAEQSTLFKRNPTYLIPYSLDLNVFRSIDQKQAREKLGLPLDKKIILFVSQSVENKRKGFEILSQSLTYFNIADKYLLCSVGKNDSPQLNVNHFSIGEIIDEEKMALAYNAADVFVIPSLEDNLPNTAIESIACGVPVIGFNIGGLPDIIRSGVNGLLVPEVDAGELAKTLELYFSNSIVFDKVAIRKDAEARYSNIVQANSYKTLYDSLLKK